MERDRSGIEMCPGERRGEFDLAQERRGGIPPAGADSVRRYGAAVIVMAFDERGQADNLERRIEICRRAYKLLTQRLDFSASDIIFDPNVLTVATGLEEHRNYAVDFIEATRWIKDESARREGERRHQ